VYRDARPTDIAFKDFRPRETAPARPPYVDAAFAPFETAVEEANEWIRRSGVDVIHVETLVLPSLELADVTGSTFPRINVYAQSSWYQLVRLWYRVPARPV
jgi:hypothetical protein